MVEMVADARLTVAAPDVVMVASAAGDRIALWKVFTGIDLGISRMVGGWVLDCAEEAVIDTLMRDRWVLATDGGRRALDQTRVAIVGYVDAAATVAGVRGEIAKLQDRFDREPRPKNRKLVPPDWPSIPDVVDADSGTAADDQAGVALGVGRWVADLAEAWDRIEKQRLARPFLIDPAGTLTRTLPIQGRTR
jgi:hypothetical protein